MEQKNKVASFYNEAFKDHPLISIPYIQSMQLGIVAHHVSQVDKSINRNLS